jgi:sterol desaturase/sphingolipid hydroxylase (fatty acid hydroxylase superfamily)
MIWGLITNNWLVFSTCIVTWLLMIWAYLPTIKLYKIAWTWAGLLPAIAFLYLFMTIDSAVKYYQGRGGAWKGRTYD